MTMGRWPDVREQLRCVCGCRRIHHTRMARAGSQGPAEETMRSCAVFGCRCPEYLEIVVVRGPARH